MWTKSRWTTENLDTAMTGANCASWVTRFHLNFPSMKSVLIVRQDVIDTMCMIIIIFVFLHMRHHFSEQCAQRAGLCQEQGCYPRVYWTMHQSTGFWSMVIWSRKTSFSGTARNSAFWWEDTNRRCLKLILHFEAAQRGVEGTRQTPWIWWMAWTLQNPVISTW